MWHQTHYHVTDKNNNVSYESLDIHYHRFSSCCDTSDVCVDLSYLPHLLISCHWNLKIHCPFHVHVLISLRGAQNLSYSLISLWRRQNFPILKIFIWTRTKSHSLQINNQQIWHFTFDVCRWSNLDDSTDLDPQKYWVSSHAQVYQSFWHKTHYDVTNNKWLMMFFKTRGRFSVISCPQV